MKMTSYQPQIITTILIFLLSFFIHAASSLAPEKRMLHFNPIVGFIGGEVFTNHQQLQSYDVDNQFEYIYEPEHASYHHLYWGASIGILTNLIPDESMDETLSLVWYENKDLYPKGQVTQGMDPESYETYPYSYQIHMKQFMVEGRIQKKFKPYFKPYFTLGLGRAKIQTSHFNVAIPPFYEFTAEFADSTQNNFSYSLATGLAFDVTERLALSIGYQFTSLGSINLGAGNVDGIPTNFQFKQSKFYLNRAILQLFFKLG